MFVTDEEWASTLRGAHAGSPRAAGFGVDEIRDAPDRPGLEFVFVARRAD